MEGIGAFFLTLAVLLAFHNGAAATPPLVAGAMLMAMTYAGTSVSGAHYNPAISLIALLRREIDRVDFPYYCLAQFAGSSLAALMASFMLRCYGHPEILPRANETFCALIAEFLGSFALVFTFLAVQQSRSQGGNPASGLAVGFVLFAGMALFQPVSGGYFNAAVALGVCMAGIAAWSDMLIYIAGSLLGAGAAFSVYRIVYNGPGGAA